MEKEPLAIYYARLMRNGRIIIPEGTRTFLKLREGDNVELMIKPSTNKVTAVFISKIGKRGLVLIPKEIRDKLKLKPGDWIEVVLLSFHRTIITSW